MHIFTKIRYCASFEDPVLSGVWSLSILHFPTFTVLLLPALVINWDKEVGGCLQLHDLHTKFCVNQPAGSKVGKGIYNTWTVWRFYNPTVSLPKDGFRIVGYLMHDESEYNLTCIMYICE